MYIRKSRETSVVLIIWLLTALVLQAPPLPQLHYQNFLMKIFPNVYLVAPVLFSHRFDYFILIFNKYLGSITTYPA